jgi:hypothetical protein
MPTFLFDDIKVVSNSLSTDFDASFSTRLTLLLFQTQLKTWLRYTQKTQQSTASFSIILLARQVMSLFPSSDSATVDIADLANGIYIAEILTASGKGNVKLLKE